MRSPAAAWSACRRRWVLPFKADEQLAQQGSELALLGGAQRLKQRSLGRQVRGRYLIDQRDSVWGELDKQSAPVTGIWHPSDQTPAFEGGEAMRHCPGRAHQSEVELGRREPVSRAAAPEAGQYIPGAARQSELTQARIYARINVRGRASQPGDDGHRTHVQLRAHPGPLLKHTIHVVRARVQRGGWKDTFKFMYIIFSLRQSLSLYLRSPSASGGRALSQPPATSVTDPRVGLALLLRRTRELEATLLASTTPGLPEERRPQDVAAHRLKRSVIRPLTEALKRMPGEGDGRDPTRGHAHGHTDAHVPAGGQADLSSTSESLWRLAADVTRLRLSPGLPTEVQEASAGLQDLACELAHSLGEDDGQEARLTELREIQAPLPCAVQSQTDGPYLVTNVENLTNWLGERLPTRPQMALCRCGKSEIKPLCDGTHAEIAFTTEKDTQRVPDRRDAYVGQQVTILDNRGTCQHSGACTDRLATVFHLGEEPFVSPSGGRMDEIIRAVRDCPSGALSYALDSVEARDDVDYHAKRDPTLEVSKDGPYRIRGDIALLDGEGQEEAQNQGASREHYALCRCGHSQNKPFCSGMHWYVDFRDPPSQTEPTIFEWADGLPALTRMTRLFYEKYVPQDPLLAPVFASMSADHPQRVAKWLAEVFCGPKDYSEQYGGYVRMISQHIGKGLTEERRARWVQLLLVSAQEAGLPSDPEWRSAFGAYIEWGSRLALENSQPGAKPPAHMPMPHWDWRTAAGPPGGRISALVPVGVQEESPVVLPAADEPVRFEKHVKPLFRASDRQSMKFAFDLWAYDDVKHNAHAILGRLRNGSMPCDGAWPQERTDAFDRWVSTGMGQ